MAFKLVITNQLKLNCVSETYLSFWYVYLKYSIGFLCCIFSYYLWRIFINILILNIAVRHVKGCPANIISLHHLSVILSIFKPLGLFFKSEDSSTYFIHNSFYVQPSTYILPSRTQPKNAISPVSFNFAKLLSIMNV